MRCFDAQEQRRRHRSAPGRSEEYADREQESPIGAAPEGRVPLPGISIPVSNGDHLTELLSYRLISTTITLHDLFPGFAISGDALIEPRRILFGALLPKCRSKTSNRARSLFVDITGHNCDLAHSYFRLDGMRRSTPISASAKLAL